VKEPTPETMQRLALEAALTQTWVSIGYAPAQSAHVDPTGYIAWRAHGEWMTGNAFCHWVSQYRGTRAAHA